MKNKNRQHTKEFPHSKNSPKKQGRPFNYLIYRPDRATTD